MGDFGNVDHKSSYSRFKRVQHLFAQPKKGTVVDHSPGDLDPSDVGFDFGGDFHALKLVSLSVRVKDGHTLK